MAASKRRGLRAVDDPVAGTEAAAEANQSPAATTGRPAAARPRPPKPARSAQARPSARPSAEPAKREVLFADIDAALKHRLDLAAVHLRIRQRELVELVLRDHLDRDDYVERLRALDEHRG